ncbi:hypothetical protein HZC32_03850 [Candidatus Woesearchaeota archaeon]|nr:hypothetical protein [Candidatus Woesearchaeota archaeon]
MSIGDRVKRLLSLACVGAMATTFSYYNYNCGGKTRTSSGYCQKDTDCPGDKICVNQACVSQFYVKTPPETFGEFANALASGDLEKALSQVHPESKTLRDALSGKSLPEEITGFNYDLGLSQLGEKLKSIDLTLKEEYGSYRDYTSPCGNNYECLFRFKKDENGQWKIERF